MVADEPERAVLVDASTSRAGSAQGGPHCSGTADEQRTPIAAVHVRQGDSCDRHKDTPGPFNSMFAWDEKKGKLDRVGFRYCYSWGVRAWRLDPPTHWCASAEPDVASARCTWTC